MKVVAIIGSYRKGKTIDTLVKKTIEGIKSANPGAEVETIYLIDKEIKYCKNCMVCRNDEPGKKIAKCIISDDMQAIYQTIDDAEGFVFGTPVNIGAVTAVMKTFLERIMWVLAKPGTMPINGCPIPRTAVKKQAVIILSSGIIPPIFRRWCDDATSLIKSVCTSALNAKVVGTLYAGAVESRGLGKYSSKAYKLGQKLSSSF